MKSFVVHLHSFDKNNRPWTTELIVDADSSNDAVIKSILWLIENELSVNMIEVDD